MRLFISNLNILTTTSHLTALFLPFGLVISAQIIRNMDTGRSAGAAFVEMEREAGKEAIGNLDNIRFMNNFIQVEETFPAMG